MNPFNLIPAPYQLLAKGLVLLSIIIALAVAYRSFTHHFIQIGIDQQLAADKKVDDAARERVRAKESLDTINNQASMNKLFEDKENERKHYEDTIAALKSGNLRMRVITGQSVNDMSNPSASPSGTPQTCSVRLPDEYGETFARVQQQVGELKATYEALQARVKQDYQTCQ